MSLSERIRHILKKIDSEKIERDWKDEDTTEQIENTGALR